MCVCGVYVCVVVVLFGDIRKNNNITEGMFRVLYILDIIKKKSIQGQSSLQFFCCCVVYVVFCLSHLSSSKMGKQGSFRRDQISFFFIVSSQSPPSFASAPGQVESVASAFS